MKHIAFTLCILISINSFAQKPILTANTGHSGIITKIEFDKNYNYLFSAADKIKMWEMDNNFEIRTFNNQPSNISDFCISSDMNMIASCGYNSDIYLCDLLTGAIIKKFSWKKGFSQSIAFANDNKLLISAGIDNDGNGMKIWNIETGECIKTIALDNTTVKQIIVCNDGKHFFSASEDNTIRKWELPECDEKLKIKLKKATLESICLNPDNTIIASEQNKAIVLWDANSGKKIRTLTTSEYVRNYIQFSPDGNYLYEAKGNDLTHWYVKDEVPPLEYNLPEGRVQNLFFYGNRLQDVVIEDMDKNIIFWNIKNKKEVKRLTSNVGHLETVVFNPDETKIYTCGEKNINAWNLETRNTLKSLIKEYYVTSIDVSQDGNYIVSGSYTQSASLWNLNTNETKKILVDNKNTIEQVAFIPQENKEAEEAYIACLEPYKVSICNMETGKLVKTLQDSSENLCMCCSKDGKYIATGGFDNLVRLWDLETEKVINTYDFQNNYIYTVCFDNMGKRIIAGGHDKTIRIWDRESGKELNILKDHRGFISCLAVSPPELEEKTGKSYLLSGSRDNAIKLWNLDNGELIKTFTGHQDEISSVSFSSSGKYVISGSDDGAIKIWDLQSGEVVITLIGFKNSDDYIVYTPDGRFDGTEKGMEKLHYVDGLKTLPLSSFFEQYYTPDLLARTISGEVFDEPEIKIEEVKLPPTVQITSPENNYLSPQKEVTINISVIDNGSSIDEIKLFHNGKLIQTTDRGFKKVSQKGQVSNKSFTIQLVEGENHFKATAFNTDRTESIPDEITVKYEGMKASTKLYFLAVGINNYKNNNLNLNYAVPDAEALINKIKTGASEIFSDVEVSFIKNTDATKQGIIEALNKIKTSALPSDVFVFYYAGHGVMGEQVEGIKADYYLVPHDVTQLYGNEEILVEKALSSNEIMKLSTEIKAQKQLLIMDACQSGGALQAFAARGAAEQKAIMQLARSTGIMVLAASGSEQFATEFDELGHGAFTYALLEGLKCQADGGQKDFKITVSELKAYLEDRLPEITEKYKGKAQYPTGYSRGQDFPIVICK